MERNNGDIPQLTKQELARSIAQSTRHIVFNSPPEIRGKYFESNHLTFQFPTRLIEFPEFGTADFSSNIRNFDAISLLGIDFLDRPHKKVGITRRKVRKSEITVLTIAIGISGREASAFTTRFNGSGPIYLNYFPPESRGNNRNRVYSRQLTMSDLQSFKRVVDLANDTIV